MATSSILENITVNNPRVIEEFLDAMEKSVNNSQTRRAHSETNFITDPKQIKEIMAKGIRNRGNKKA